MIILKKTLTVIMLLATLPGLCYAKTAKIDLKSGQRFSIVLSKVKPGGEKSLQTYINGMLPIAEQEGMQTLSAFAIPKTIIGDSQAEFLGLYAWPNADIAEKTRNNEVYEKKYKPLQKQAWQELTIIDSDISQNLSFSHSKNKTYTFAQVWIKDQISYDNYYQSTITLRDSLGAKMLFKLPVHDYQTFDASDIPPDLIVLIEWPTPNGPQLYLNSMTFKENQAKAQAGIEKINWYQLNLANI